MSGRIVLIAAAVGALVATLVALVRRAGWDQTARGDLEQPDESQVEDWGAASWDPVDDVTGSEGDER